MGVLHKVVFYTFIFLVKNKKMNRVKTILSFSLFQNSNTKSYQKSNSYIKVKHTIELRDC